MATGFFMKTTWCFFFHFIFNSISFSIGVIIELKRDKTEKDRVSYKNILPDLSRVLAISIHALSRNWLSLLDLVVTA